MLCNTIEGMKYMWVITVFEETLIECSNIVLKVRQQLHYINLNKLLCFLIQGKEIQGIYSSGVDSLFNCFH